MGIVFYSLSAFPVLAPTDYLYGMHTLGQAFYEMKNELSGLYDEREATAITHEILNHITGLSKLDRMMSKDEPLSDLEQLQYNEARKQLATGRPLQYVTGKAWFLEREYEVEGQVLIPRPETEELVLWITEDHKQKTDISIIDVGTGSGVIPVSLKLAMPNAEVTAIDISEAALEIAARNAARHAADIQFIGMDILDSEQQNNTGIYDVIVSNPPYIPVSEKVNMHSNVKDHEPAIALFVPDDDALLFYRAIAQYGKAHLKPHGKIYCELEVNHAMETKMLFEQMGYVDVEIRKDMHDNWRMIKATAAR
jgi:release factor glutamine methyltransferase